MEHASAQRTTETKKWLMVFHRLNCVLRGIILARALVRKGTSANLGAFGALRHSGTCFQAPLVKD